MRGALLEYLRLMGRLWLMHLVEVLSAGVGGARDLELVPVIPAWIFYVGAVGLFVLANFWAFYTVYKEVTQYRTKPKADTSLHIVFDRLYERATKAHMHNDAIELAINSIVEKAAAGEIQIFGTTMDPRQGNGPTISIPVEYWRENTITIYGNKAYFGLPPGARETQTRTRGECDVYFTLKTDSAQAQLCWPQEKRFKFQWPFRREVVDVSR